VRERRDQGIADVVDDHAAVLVDDAGGYAKEAIQPPDTLASGRASEKRVNPSMSANSTHASRVRGSSSPEPMSCSATCVGT
jgi:hypothetical protein